MVNFLAKLSWRTGVSIHYVRPDPSKLTDLYNKILELHILK